MSMRIAQIAPLAEPVPPELYGGTERVVSLLTEELVRRGHEVTLFASGDSETDARLVPVTREALRRDPEDVDPNLHLMLELGLVFERAHQFDVIHSHVDYFALPLARLVKTPVVTTLHGRLDLPGLRTIYGQVQRGPAGLDQRQPTRPAPRGQLGRDGLQRNRPRDASPSTRRAATTSPSWAESAPRRTSRVRSPSLGAPACRSGLRRRSTRSTSSTTSP